MSILIPVSFFIFISMSILIPVSFFIFLFAPSFISIFASISFPFFIFLFLLLLFSLLLLFLSLQPFFLFFLLLIKFAFINNGQVAVFLPAFFAEKLLDILCLLLSHVDTVAMIPFLTVVTSNHKSVHISTLADAVDSFSVLFFRSHVVLKTNRSLVEVNQANL